MRCNLSGALGLALGGMGDFISWLAFVMVSRNNSLVLVNFLRLAFLGGAIALAPMPQLLAQLTSEELEDPQYWKSLCALQSDAGSFGDAVTSCEQAIALNPKDSDGWALYSEVLLRQESYPEAIAASDKALSFNGENSLAFANKCMAFFKLGEPEKALDLCNNALRVNGSWGGRSPVMAWQLRGQLFGMQGKAKLAAAIVRGEVNPPLPTDFEQALTSFERALLQEPEDALLHAYRCEALLNLRRYDMAIAACQQSLALDPELLHGAMTWDLQGQAQTQLGQYEMAIAAYDQALSLDPENFNIWTNQAWVLELLGQQTEALTSYEQAIALKPDHARALVAKCKLLNRLGQYEPALAACDLAIAGDGQWWSLGMAQVWNEKSFSLSGLGKYEEALAAVNRAVGIRPHYPEAWNNRAVVLWYLKRYPEAIAATEQSIALDNAYAQPWATQGAIFRAMGNYSQALNAYEKALLIAPENANAWSNKSLILWHLGSYEQGILAAERAIGLAPESLQSWMNLAVNQVALKRFDAALGSYARASEIAPENADVWTGLGVVFARLNRQEEALAALQQAIALNPGQNVAIAEIKRLNALAEQTKK
jgi:tetratricopeptide (TPR) repeat protein